MCVVCEREWGALRPPSRSTLAATVSSADGLSGQGGVEVHPSYVQNAEQQQSARTLPTMNSITHLPRQRGAAWQLVVALDVPIDRRA